MLSPVRGKQANSAFPQSIYISWPSFTPLYPEVPIVDACASVGEFHDEHVHKYFDDPSVALIFCLPFENRHQVANVINLVEKQQLRLGNTVPNTRPGSRVGILLLSKNGIASKIRRDDGSCVKNVFEGYQVCQKQLETQVPDSHTFQVSLV